MHGAPVSHLGAMLEEWIQWAPGDSRGSKSFATIGSLKKALSETGLGAAAHDFSVATDEEVPSDSEATATGHSDVFSSSSGGEIEIHHDEEYVEGIYFCLYPTYDVDQSYRQGNICDIALWLGQYHDISLWYS